MTTSKYEQSINELSCSDEAKRLKALRFIRNSVIGNKTRKDLYIKLGVVQKLVEYLSLPENSSYALKTQAATVLGSIAYGKDDNVSTIVAAGTISRLLDTLAPNPNLSVIDSIRENRKLLEAVTRALKSIFLSPSTPKDDIFTEKHLCDIVTLLDATSSFLCQQNRATASAESLSFGMIAESTAAILSKCCDTQEQQMQLASAGVIQPLVNLLHSGHAKAQEAALDALSTLCRENGQLGEFIIHAKPIDSNQLTTATMLDFARDKCPNMRLIACTCLTNLYRTNVFEEPFNEIVLVVLPALVKILTEASGDAQERAPLVIADLVKDSEDMQRAAYEADAIPCLVELLTSSASKENEDGMYDGPGIPGTGSVAKRREKIRENCLIAIAASTLMKEECRSQAISAKVLPHVVSALQSKQPHVRLAACQCAKSLSRSVSNLRTSLVDAGVTAPLLNLLKDESSVVQAAACGALCNLALDFSPMKKSVIEGGAVERFVQYSRSGDPKLQLNGVWALNSLLYKSDLQAKKSIMKVLTYDSLIELLHDPNPDIQEQALEMLRNLVCGQREVIEMVIDGIGKEDLLDVLESKLQVTSNMGLEGEDSSTMSAILLPTLFVVVNMSSDYEAPRAMLSSRASIVGSVISHLSHVDPSVRAAAAWCMINWTWSNKDEDETARQSQLDRVRRLRALGVVQKLEAMDEDPCRDVRDRARTAMEQICSYPD